MILQIPIKNGRINKKSGANLNENKINNNYKELAFGVLNKATSRKGKIAVKKMVTRKGKTFTQTYWMTPEEYAAYKKKKTKKTVNKVEKKKSFEGFKPNLKYYMAEKLGKYLELVNKMPKEQKKVYEKVMKKEFGTIAFNHLLKKFQTKDNKKIGENNYSEYMYLLGKVGKVALNNIPYYIIDNFNSTLLAMDMKTNIKLEYEGVGYRDDGLEVTLVQRDKKREQIAKVTDFVCWENAEQAIKESNFSKSWKKSIIKRMKKNSGYIRWKVEGGDLKLKKSVDKLKKLTGLEINTHFTKMNLTSSYVDKISKAFEDISKHVDVKKYIPPDGRKLKIAFEGAGKTIKGKYYEQRMVWFYCKKNRK